MGSGSSAERFEFDLGTIDPARPRGPEQQPADSSRRWLVAVVALVGAGIWWGFTWGPADEDQRPPTPDTFPTTTVTIPERIGPSPEQRAPESSELPGGALLEPFPPGLQSTLALSAFRGPLPGDHVILTLTPDGQLRRALAPLQPGDWPYPLVFAGSSVAFTGTETAFRLAIDSLEVAPLPVESTRYLVPGARPGDIWVIHDGTPLDTVTAIPSDADPLTHTVAGIRWVEAGVADGLLVRPVEERAPDAVAYWSPAGGLEHLSSTRANQVVLAASGDLAALSDSDGRTVEVIDARTDATVTELALDDVAELVADRHVQNACFSPDRSHLTVSTSEISLTYRLDDPTTPLHAIRGVAPHHALAYTGPAELAAVVADHTLTGIDVSSGRQWAIAELSERNWWIASSVSSC